MLNIAFLGVHMELKQYTKKELIDMFTSAVPALDFYAALEKKTVVGGRPFAKPTERIASQAITDIQQIQIDAIEKRKQNAQKSKTVEGYSEVEKLT